MSQKQRKKHLAAGGRRPPQALASRKAGHDLAQALAAAIRYHKAGDLAQAEKLYAQIIAIDPRHAETLHAQAILACQRGQHVTAVDLFQQAIRQDPARPAYHYNLGNALKDLGRFAEATPCYEQALRLKPDYSEALNNLGTVLQGQGRLAEAVASYEKAIQLKPGYAEALYNMANCLHSLQRLPEAIVCLQQAMQAKEDFPEVYNCLGNIFLEQGKLDAAVNCFQHALRLNPNVAEFHFNLATAFKELCKFDEALTGFQKAVELAPGLASAHNNLGNVFKGKGRLPEAIASYNKALQLLPDYAMAHGNRGYALAQLGDLNGAIASCRRALAIDPDIQEVCMLLVTLLFTTRDWQKFAELIDALLANRTISELDRNWLIIQQAIHAWTNNKPDRCSEFLQAAASIQRMALQGKYEISRLAFYCLLKKLVDYRTAFPQLYVSADVPPAFMIGDSHCLCFANLQVGLDGTSHKVESRLISGCKAYHLAKKDNNLYQEAFLRNIADLAAGSTVILAFGEIDCRTDEGIYDAWVKKFQHRAIEEMVQEVAAGYTAFIADLQQEKNFKLMILGIPAPMKSESARLEKDALATYLSVPKLLNKYLQSYAAQHGWAFLDAYALTCDEQGFANGHHHLDEHHLYPATLALLAKGTTPSQPQTLLWRPNT